MADKVGLGPDGYRKTGDIASGAAKGAAAGAAFGLSTGPLAPILTPIGAAVGGIAGGMKAGKVDAADRAGYYARQEAANLMADPTKVKGMGHGEQQKNIAASMQAVDPKAYAAAMQDPAMARQYQADIQKMGQAAVGTQAQMVAKAQQAQRDQILNLLNYDAELQRSEKMADAYAAKAKKAEQEAEQMQMANLAQLGQGIGEVFG